MLGGFRYSIFLVLGVSNALLRKAALESIRLFMGSGWLLK